MKNGASYHYLKAVLSTHVNQLTNYRKNYVNGLKRTRLFTISINICFQVLRITKLSPF